MFLSIIEFLGRTNKISSAKPQVPTTKLSSCPLKLTVSVYPEFISTENDLSPAQGQEEIWSSGFEALYTGICLSLFKKKKSFW